MDAFKCDKCGALVDGRPSSNHAVLEQDAAGFGWVRKLESVTLKVLITPNGDPTGFGGIALCKVCVRELVALITEGRVKHPKRGKKQR